MESTSIEGLHERFVSKLESQHTCLLWRDSGQDESCLSELEVVNKNVGKLVGKMCEFKLEVGEHKAKLEEMNALNQALQKMEERLSHMLINIPERLPKCQKEKPQKDVSIRDPLAIVTKTSESQENIRKSGNPQLAKPTGKQANVYVPEIDFLRTDEFDQIPKYQKGKITYDQINKFIEGFNQAFKSKYRILKMKKSKMKDIDRDRYDKYMLQENKDTSGCYFVVDQDLKDFGGLKIDNTARNIFTILRHCGRIKEIRGGNLTRYRYVDSY